MQYIIHCLFCKGDMFLVENPHIENRRVDYVCRECNALGTFLKRENPMDGFKRKGVKK